MKQYDLFWKDQEGGVTTLHFRDWIHYCRVVDSTPCRGVAGEHMLVYVFSGEVEVTCNNKKYHLRAGDSYILRRNHMSQKVSKPTADGRPFEGVFFYFKVPMLRHAMSQHNISLRGAEPYTRRSPYIPLPRHPFLANLFESLRGYFQAERFPSEQLMELKMQETVLTLLEINPDLKSLLFDFADPIKIDLRQFMEQYYLQDLDLSGLAHYAGRSLSAFKSDFAQTFQQSPSRWIISRRLTEAKRRMEQDGEKPVDVYQEVGFKSLSHFSKAFKQQFGVAPSMITS